MGKPKKFGKAIPVFDCSDDEQGTFEMPNGREGVTCSNDEFKLDSLESVLSFVTALDPVAMTITTIDSHGVVSWIPFAHDEDMRRLMFLLGQESVMRLDELNLIRKRPLHKEN